MPLTTDTDLFHTAVRRESPPIGTPEPGPATVTGPGPVPAGDLRVALDHCGRWLNDRFGPGLEALAAVTQASGTAPGIWLPGGTAPEWSNAQLDGVRAARIPAALLIFGDPAELAALLVHAGRAAQWAVTALETAGYPAVLDTRGGVARRPGDPRTHLCSVLTAERAA